MIRTGGFEPAPVPFRKGQGIIHPKPFREGPHRSGYLSPTPSPSRSSGPAGSRSPFLHPSVRFHPAPGLPFPPSPSRGPWLPLSRSPRASFLALLTRFLSGSTSCTVPALVPAGRAWASAHPPRTPATPPPLSYVMDEPGHPFHPQGQVFRVLLPCKKILFPPLILLKHLLSEIGIGGKIDE